MARHYPLIPLLAIVLSGPVTGGGLRYLLTADGVPGESLGRSVALVGDFNADGYADLAGGAPNSSLGASFGGAIHVYFGGPGYDDTPDLSFVGTQNSEWLGVSLAAAGDVNGDGYPDIIAGAEGYNGVGTDSGRAYVYFGGPGADATPDWIVDGPVTGDKFGHVVAGAGDVDGDGFDDILVSSIVAGSFAGKVYLYLGGSSPNSIVDVVMSGENASDLFGTSIAGAGDVNRDGFDDVLVGALTFTGAVDDQGKGYLYLGSATPNSILDLSFLQPGASADDHFGTAVAGVGDVNDDGFDDFVITADDVSATGSVGGGRAYVYNGGPSVNNGVDLTLFARDPDLIFFGASACGAGDVNGDGVSDILIGLPGEFPLVDDLGKGYVFFGGADIDDVEDAVLDGKPGDGIGDVVAGGHDFDGDGLDDVAFGMTGHDAGGTNAGRLYVAGLESPRIVSPNGGETWVSGALVTVRWTGNEPMDLWLSTDGGAGWQLLAGDLGGRRANEHRLLAPAVTTDFAKVRIRASGSIAIGPATADDSDAVFRIVPVHHPPSSAAMPLVTVSGSGLGDDFGWSVSGVGDVNGDGHDDFVVGARVNDDAAADAGAAYVFHGGPNGDAVADLTLLGQVAGDRFGTSVAGVGDVNGDGFADILVGAHLNGLGGSTAGAAYLFLGGPSMDATADLILTGEAAGDQFGVGMDGVGDMNGDGFADFVVGAALNDAAGFSAGRAYVYHGGSSPDGAADLVFTGEAAGDWFGFVPRGAGDVNGDGFPDVVVGAHNHDTGGSDAGRAYIYLGGPAADAVADWVLTGEEAGDSFGFVVDGAGDVDGDGFADVIVGAYLSDNFLPDRGAAYVYHGGPAADSSPDLRLIGSAYQEYFGRSVGSAGDVNGDGYGDVIVGAEQSSPGILGSAYVFYGGPGADALHDFVFASGVGNDRYGFSAAAAGDINGDGFGDILVGAYDGAEGAVYAYDMNRYHLTNPVGGEVWPVGSEREVNWLGSEPADVWLSVDGGHSYDLLESDVGGGSSNTLTLRVPHAPTRFARVRLTPNATEWGGLDTSDSLFTIEASVSLLSLKAGVRAEGGVELSWSTDPGPEELLGYRVDRDEGGQWRTLVGLTRETSISDGRGTAGTGYRVYAVNGLGGELLVGETRVARPSALSAWPLPYRSGEMWVRFATTGGLGGGAGRTEVWLYDVSGRRVRNIAGGAYEAGTQEVRWDGLDDRGVPVAAGIYFLRVRDEIGSDIRLKVTVLR